MTEVRIDQDPDAAVDVVNVNGQVLRHGVKGSEALDGLQPGIYIVGGRKVLVN